MPLPPPHAPWPPPKIAPALAQVEADSAWLTGEIGKYSTDILNPIDQRPTAPRGGFLGALAGHGVGGRPGPTDGGATTPYHLPVPWTMAQASADLLVGKRPGFSVHEEDAGLTHSASYLEELTGPDAFSADLHRAFTYCSGLGWTFGRVVWNQLVDPNPWIDWADADQAWAEWEWGRVSAVTFWDEYPDPSGKERTVWRLLERHEVGAISRALYAGTTDSLGELRPFSAHPDTAHLDDISPDGRVLTGIPISTAYLIPNVEGNPKWRREPQLRKLGMSDIQKGGQVWGVIDKVWTETVHEIDAARARLLVSEELLDDQGPGRGMSFNWGRDVFRVGQSASVEAGPTIEQVQFQLRIEQYRAALDLAEAKAREAVGLSGITIGQETDGPSMTATEIRAKSTATMNTWEGKARMVRAGLSGLATAAAMMHAQINGHALPARPVNVSLEDPVQETELDRTMAAKNLRDARAASTKYLVRRLHPEWDDAQIEEEVAEILSEDSPADPFLLAPDVHPNDAEGSGG